MSTLIFIQKKNPSTHIPDQLHYLHHFRKPRTQTLFTLCKTSQKKLYHFTIITLTYSKDFIPPSHMPHYLPPIHLVLKSEIFIEWCSTHGKHQHDMQNNHIPFDKCLSNLNDARIHEFSQCSNACQDHYIYTLTHSSHNLQQKRDDVASNINMSIELSDFISFF